MKVPKNIIDRWDVYRSHGDLSEIARIAGVNVMTVHRVFTHGRITPDLFEIMAQFYAEREELLRQYQD